MIDPAKKLEILQKAQELGSITKACIWAGISRPTFYKYLNRYEQAGSAALEERSRRHATPYKSITEQLQDAILRTALENPEFSSRVIIKKLPTKISVPTVRKYLTQAGLATLDDRVQKLNDIEQSSPKSLTDHQYDVLTGFNICYRDRSSLGKSPGAMLGLDHRSLGEFKINSQRQIIYCDTVVDTCSNFAFGLLGVSSGFDGTLILAKIVVPFFNDIGKKILYVGIGYYPEINGIDHPFIGYLRANKINRDIWRKHKQLPHGFNDQFFKIMKKEFFTRSVRATSYKELADLQSLLDQWIYTYNHRQNPGYPVWGQIPANLMLEVKNSAG
jgi:hypothetical protein